MIGALVIQNLESSIDSEQNNSKYIRTKTNIESGLWEIHDNIVETQNINDLINDILIKLCQYLNGLFVHHCDISST